LRLDPAEPHGFIRDWVIASVLPERHQMYALQWLAFSLIIVIAYGCFSIQRVEKIS
jgi:cytochrome oxidase assembly protein ShyY1